MTISVVGQYPKFRAYDPATKLPLTGGFLYCYAPGTTTNKTIYTDYARTIAAANPVVLDANGEGLFYLDGVYDLVLKDSALVTVWTVANYNDQPVSASASTTAPAVEGSVTNPSFEYEGTTTGLPANWDIFKWNTVALDTSVSFSGSNSLKFVSPGGASGVSGGGTATSTKFVVDPSSVVNIGVTLKSSVAGVHNQVQLLEYNSANALVATTTVYDDTTTNPVVFTTYWKPITVTAATAWVKVYLVGAKNDSAVAGTTWFDSVEIKNASAGATIALNNGALSSTIVLGATSLRVTAPAFVVDSAAGNTQTSVTGILSASTTLNVLSGTDLVCQGNTVAINGLASTAVTTPALTLNAGVSANLVTTGLTLSASGAITLVTPLVTTVLGLVVGAATGGAKGNGTINAVGLYQGGVALVPQGTSALTSALTLSGFGVVLGAPTGGTLGAGTINAVGVYQNGLSPLFNGANALTGLLDFTGGFLIRNSDLIYVFTNRAVVAAVAASATTQALAHGRVSAAGLLLHGQGFTSVRNGVGVYTITWSSAFSAVPAVAACTEGLAATFVSAIPGLTTAVISTFNAAGAAVDVIFDAVVVGNR